MKDILFSGRLSYDMILSKAHYLGTIVPAFAEEGIFLTLESTWIDNQVTYYVFNKPFWVEFGGYHWDFEAGFITDFLSIPSYLSSIFPTNNLKVGALTSSVHDANFAFNLLSFEESNRIFFEMLKAEGFSVARATLFSSAVGSEKGRAIYDNPSPRNNAIRCKVTRLH